MNPLSISASIVRITTAATQVGRLLKPFIDGAFEAPTSARGLLMEVTGIYACLHQLQGFLMGNEEAAQSRRSLIMIEQVIIIFTDCVSIFSELEQNLESLKAVEYIQLIDRMKWASKESTISKLITRLEASKISLNLMLTILTCTSIDWAEASMRNLTRLVQEVLKANVNMASRLKNLEKMHPALATNDNAFSGGADSRTVSRKACYRFAFEKDLEMSLVYQRVGLNQIRFSTSSTSSYGPSRFSDLSLSDVSNVSAIALPISSLELWNPNNAGSATSVTSLDAWYNPPAQKSAFIRTAYFNGQYTNQYAQSRFTGHLIYRRFTIMTPHSPPVFISGAMIPQSSKQLGRIGEESAPKKDERFELEDTSIEHIPPELECGQMTLVSALNMTASDLHASSSSTTSLPQDISTTSDDAPLYTPPTKRILPLSPPEVWWKGGKTRKRKRDSLHPISLTKALVGMGDALNWKLGVLHRINAIE